MYLPENISGPGKLLVTPALQLCNSSKYNVTLNVLLSSGVIIMFTPELLTSPLTVKSVTLFVVFFTTPATKCAHHICIVYSYKVNSEYIYKKHFAGTKQRNNLCKSNHVTSYIRSHKIKFFSHLAKLPRVYKMVLKETF